MTAALLNRDIALPIAGAALGLAVAVLVQERAPQRPRPVEYGFSAWSEKCQMESMGLTPEAWTRRGDADRIVGGRYAEPLPIRCVIGSYRLPALKRAAAAGDPVARLALVYDDLRKGDPPCDRLDALRRDLTAAYQPRRSAYDLAPTAHGAPVARVPEAALLLSQVFARCGQPSQAKAFEQTAWDLGLDTRAAQATIETPAMRRGKSGV